ncbi:DNA N-6-adenine-methyltransferase [Gracilibacillus saliphilus]|uniref:DNA N-6-adenine-methyltransferase n=1 Tax=Gracilibacillus saliphilus TaxID=543890 RepID=UPI0013D1C44A|nr:DNA N-6-adenine-methyltransferase [Gracilibacillus saliphilus]
MNQALLSSKKMDWGTPNDFFEELNQEFNFTLDVCASHDNAKVNNYFTEEDNGLEQNWHGTCWMNPPYGREIGKWVKKAYEESLKGVTVVCLIPSRTDTRYWHEYVMRAKEIRFIKGRLRFIGATENAPFPNAIVVFGPPKFMTMKRD